MYETTCNMPNKRIININFKNIHNAMCLLGKVV